MFENVPESFWLRNPHLAHLRGRVGSVVNPERKHDKRREGEAKGLEECQIILGYCITIISARRRLVDGHDNLRTGAKPLVDAIAKSLGFSDDSDSRLIWQYQQFVTAGDVGTAVVIQSITSK